MLKPCRRYVLFQGSSDRQKEDLSALVSCSNSELSLVKDVLSVVLRYIKPLSYANRIAFGLEPSLQYFSMQYLSWRGIPLCELHRFVSLQGFSF